MLSSCWCVLSWSLHSGPEGEVLRRTAGPTLDNKNPGRLAGTIRLLSASETLWSPISVVGPNSLLPYLQLAANQRPEQLDQSSSLLHFHYFLDLDNTLHYSLHRYFYYSFDKSFHYFLRFFHGVSPLWLSLKTDGIHFGNSRRFWVRGNEDIEILRRMKFEFKFLKDV